VLCGVSRDDERDVPRIRHREPLPYGVRLTNVTTDESVLAFIGRAGRSTAAVAERFPGFDVMRLVRAQLVDIAYAEPGETVAHLQELELGEMRYVLTDRGAAAIGLPPS